MRKVLASMLCLGILLLALPAAAAPVGADEVQVKAVAEPILDNLLAGFNQGDYAQYSKDFDDTLREAIPEKKFQQVRQELLKKLGHLQQQNLPGFFESAGPHRRLVERQVRRHPGRHPHQAGPFQATGQGGGGGFVVSVR